MRVGLITAELTHRNGWAHYSSSLRAALQRAGVETRIMAARNTPPDRDALAVLPTLTPPQRGTLSSLLRWSARARDHFKDCDLIHVTAEPYAPLGAAIAGQRPLFVTVHGSYVHLPRLRRFPVGALYGWAFRRGTLVCVSHYTERVARDLLPNSRTLVINNGVDPARFADLPPRPDDGPPLLLTVGGVKARKGTLELVRAVAALRDDVPDLRCAIIGSTDAEPAYTDRVRAEIERLGLRDAVHMHGHVDDAALRDWYARSRIFVLPSLADGWKFEGFGLAHLEASAAGLPVIGTRDCGAEDAIAHGETGLLIAPDRLAHDLPVAIRDLLRDPARARRMGDLGRQRAQVRTWDAVAQQMIDAYTQSLRHARL